MTGNFDVTSIKEMKDLGDLGLGYEDTTKAKSRKYV